MRWSANIPAKSASSPTRSGAITVTREPSSVCCTWTEISPLRTSRGISTSSMSTGGRLVPLSRAARTRRARSRTRPERQADHAWAEAALASASVRVVSSESASVVPMRLATRSTVAGSSGSRVVAVSESSRCHRTSRAINSTAEGSKPIRAAISRASGWPATLCSVRLPLPMSCSSAATMSTSGRLTWRIREAASRQVSTTWRSTVKRWIAEACGSSRMRSHSGSSRLTAPVSSRVSHTCSRPLPASIRTSCWRASAGHGSGIGGVSRARRAAVGGASTTSSSLAAAAARRSRTGSSDGRALASSTISLRDSATPGATGVSWGRRAVRADTGRLR